MMVGPFLYQQSMDRRSIQLFTFLRELSLYTLSNARDLNFADRAFPVFHGKDGGIDRLSEPER